ncbi:MAG: 4Fe-4S binding protein [Clostridia bacterium]|nr:4Fe-4S binding protein [Clostridia bacterium]
MSTISLTAHWNSMWSRHLIPIGLAKARRKMVKKIQTAIQIILLVLFLFLLARGKVQAWMMVFLGSAILGLFLGRFYCGWICPMNTVMRFQTWLKKKLHIKSLAIPTWMTKPWVRIVILVAFLGLAALGIIGNKPLPVLPALFFLGIGLTLFFPELLWHRYLCPYGTILSLPGRLSKKKMTIEASACVNCGACAKVCPTATIHKPEGGKHQIEPAECLVCRKCVDACKFNAIHYR